ncbi:DUF2637 domain-containing protein [Streptomyces thermogriseus]|uniref:DUF2637 domain-containing protein n=1 Tax=Streptomyces thermogriseus TaxID=75292 RepID=A0ABN1T0N2_9ACTN
MTTHAVPRTERQPPIPVGRNAADNDVLVPIRGGLLASAFLVGFAAVALAVIGFTGSYRAVRDLALSWGWGWFAYVFPIGIDVGIVGLIAADLFLCAIRTPAPILRWFAWTLTVATVTFNAASGWPADGTAGWSDVIEAAAHATMPGLVVVITEALRRAIARRARIADGRQFEPLGMARWLLAPLATFAVWRRMRLWDVYTRAEALALERDRLTLRDELREKYGKDWKKKARPGELRAMRDASRGLSIPAHLIANDADPPTANTANASPLTANADPPAANASTAHTGSAAREHPALAEDGANTVNAANAKGAPPANGPLNGVEAARTPWGKESEHMPSTASGPAPHPGVDLRESDREQPAVPASAPPRRVVSAVSGPYAPVEAAVGDGRELVGVNAGAVTANTAANTVANTVGASVNGVNALREDAAGSTAEGERERLRERYTEDLAGRLLLAEDYLKAKAAEPQLSQKRFAERVGVAPSTLSKALGEWRERNESGVV